MKGKWYLIIAMYNYHTETKTIELKAINEEDALAKGKKELTMIPRHRYSEASIHYIIPIPVR